MSRPHHPKSADRRQFFPKVDGDFQWRYSFALGLAVGLTLLVFMGPFLYFLNQNFEIFRSLAIEYQPNLLEHMEREVQWITFIGFAGLVSAVSFSVIFGYKITASIIGPLFSIERHMKRVAQGHWDREDFRVRSTDEFKRLATTYSHCYRVLRNDIQEDLQTLEHIASLSTSARNNEEIKFTVSKMIEAKRKKLGLSEDKISNEENAQPLLMLQQGNGITAGSSEESALSPKKRRAS